MVKYSFKWKKFDDLLLVVLLPIIASILTIKFNLSFLVSTILFFGVPLAYLLFRNPHLVKKALACGGIMIPVTFILDYFAIKDGSWWDSTIFNQRLLNGIPYDDFAWFVLYFVYIVIFYEYFLDKEGKTRGDSKLNKRYKYFFEGWCVALGLFFFLYVVAEKYLYIPYFYLSFTMVLGVVPLSLFLWKKYSFITRFSKMIVYFFALNLLHEYSAQSAHHWVFPGKNFIGWVSMVGMQFPVEELLMWMILGSLFVIPWYEYFVDDFR